MVTEEVAPFMLIPPLVAGDANCKRGPLPIGVCVGRELCTIGYGGGGGGRGGTAVCTAKAVLGPADDED